MLPCGMVLLMCCCTVVVFGTGSGSGSGDGSDRRGKQVGKVVDAFVHICLITLDK